MCICVQQIGPWFKLINLYNTTCYLPSISSAASVGTYPPCSLSTAPVSELYLAVIVNSSGTPSSGSSDSLSSEISISAYSGLFFFNYSSASLTFHYLTQNIAGIVGSLEPFSPMNVIPIVADKILAGGGKILPSIIPATCQRSSR